MYSESNFKGESKAVTFDCGSVPIRALHPIRVRVRVGVKVRVRVRVRVRVQVRSGSGLGLGLGFGIKLGSGSGLGSGLGLSAARLRRVFYAQLLLMPAVEFALTLASLWQVEMLVGMNCVAKPAMLSGFDYHRDLT